MGSEKLIGRVVLVVPLFFRLLIAFVLVRSMMASRPSQTGW
jgi:hypothetical protein